MALSAISAKKFNEASRGPVRTFPQKGSTTVYGGAALGLSGGYARPLISGDVFVGFADDKDVANAGADGATVVGVIQNGEAVLTVAGSSAVTDQGSTVYATDDDTFTLTPGGSPIGEVVGWISGTSCYVRFYGRLTEPNAKEPNAVAAKTAAYTVTAAESGKRFTNTGASGAIAFTLPAAAIGLEYWFWVGAAQELRIDPNGSETIALPSTGAQSAAGKYISADAVGEWVHVECVKAGEWAVMGYLGTWTAEA